MSASTKLFTAIQSLCLLATSEQQPLTSDELSLRTGTHPARLRNILSMLARDGIVRSVRGSAGGFTLARPAVSIHLQEVYCAVETEKAFHLKAGKKNAVAHIEYTTLRHWFLGLFADIQILIEDQMRGITIAQILEQIQIETASSQQST